MTSPRTESFAPLRIAAAAACGLPLLELGIFVGLGIPVTFSGFAISLGLGLWAAGVWWAGVSLFRRLSGHPGDPARVTSLAVALALLYLIITDWFAESVFHGAGALRFGLAQFILLAVVIALGRMFYIFFTVRGPDLAKARFQSLAPVAVICAALYSLADLKLQGPNFALASLAIVLFLAAGQYAGIRMLWGGRRDKWRRAGLRIQYLLLAAALILLVFIHFHAVQVSEPTFLAPRALSAIASVLSGGRTGQ